MESIFCLWINNHKGYTFDKTKTIKTKNNEQYTFFNEYIKFKNFFIKNND